MSAIIESGKIKTSISPFGLIGRIVQLPNHAGDPVYPLCSASLGDVSRCLPTVRQATNGRFKVGQIDGAGSGLDLQTAMTRAIGEAIERYSTCVFSDEQFIWATAAELGEEALDLDQLPACSEEELAHSMCPVRPVDKNAPIRWVRGVSLISGRVVWIPAVMVYLHIPPKSPGERFNLPISTGCAAHVSVEQALVSAICEVIERDSISLTWLQQLPLPRVEFNVIPDALQPFIERQQASCVETLLFDATTDLGIPTIYSVELSPNNRTLATLVMCATDLDPIRCIEKVMRESASSRSALQNSTLQGPGDPDLFHSVFDGASYMGRPERQSAFDFLTHSPNRRRVTDLPSLDTGDSVKNLALLIGRLRSLGMEAYAVDLSTDEALRAGLRVVRVIIPQLQPLTFSFRARFLSHPRLYEAPHRMGYPVRSEDAINPWPQPFA